MSDLNPVFLPMSVTALWNEAIAKADDSTWRTCAYLAGLEADAVAEHEPNHILVPVLRGIADKAHENYLALAGVAA